MNKKTIIAAMMAVIVLLGFTGRINAEEPIFKFGVMSDLHNQQTLIAPSSGNVDDVKLRGTVMTVLEKFKQDENLDLLVLNGDYTSDVTIPEDNWNRVKELLMSVTRNVFHGEKTPVIYVTGNHEFEVANFDNIPKPYNAGDFYPTPMKDDIGELSDSESFYEDADNGAYGTQNLLAAYHYQIHGFDFVVLNCGKYFFKSAWDYQYSEESVQWVANKLAEIYADNANKTVFFISHMPFADSKSMSNTNKGLKDCTSTTLLKSTLAQYPNLIHIYGHDHGSDNAYIRTETAQRVTQYDTDGNVYTGGASATETSGLSTIKSLKTGKYLGRLNSSTDNMRTFDEKYTATIASSGDMYHVTLTTDNYQKDLHIGTGGRWSTGDASDVMLFKVNETVGGVTTATRVTDATVSDGDYLLVGLRGSDYYAMTNEEFGEGADLRLGGEMVTLSNNNMTVSYTDEELDDDFTAVWTIAADVAESKTPSFISAFDGSMRYYGNTFDPSSSANDSKIAQALLVYVYKDKIELQMKNYAATGDINNTGIVIAEPIAPYVITRTVEGSGSAEEEVTYPAINHHFTKADQVNRFLDRVSYKSAGEESATDLFDMNLGKDDLSDYPAEVNEVLEGNGIISHLSPAIAVAEGDASFDLTCYSTHGKVIKDGVTSKNNMTWVNQKVYVDWNGDGDFLDENEAYAVTEIAGSSSSANPPVHPFRLDAGYTRTVEIPAGTKPGVYRMYVAYGQEGDGTYAWTWDMLFDNNIVGLGNVYEFNVEVVGSVANVPATPVFSVEGGEYDDVQNVAISCETEGAEIHYTIDGTVPTTGSDVYTEPIVVDADMTIKAVAVKNGVASAVASATYTVALSDVRPMKIVEGFSSDIIAEVSPLSSSTNFSFDGWVLYSADYKEQGGLPVNGKITAKSGMKYQLADYSANNALVLDGYGTKGTLKFNAPQSVSEVYVLGLSDGGSSPTDIKVNYEDGTSETKSVSVDDWFSEQENQGEAYYGYGRGSENEMDLRYNFRMFEFAVPTDVKKKVASVTLENKGWMGAWPAFLAVSVKLESKEAGKFAVTVPSDIEGVALTVMAGETELQSGVTDVDAGTELHITAVADEGYTVTAIKVNGEELGEDGLYTVNEDVAITVDVVAPVVPATPVFSVEGGLYEEAQTVEITCETEDAEIHYTIDGTVPTTESDVYTEPIAVAENMTIKAIAVKDGVESEVATAEYVINTTGESVHTVRISEGFNSDVIAEAKPVSSHANNSLDNQKWNLYSVDVQEQGGLPANGQLTTKSGLKYQLADYTANNALVLKSYYQGTDLMFATPQYASEVYVLAISANGDSYVEIKVKYEDGTFAVKNADIKDWYKDSEGDGEAYYGLGRINFGGTYYYNEDQIDGSYCFRLFELTIPTDNTKKISAVRVTNFSNSSYPTVLAVSRKGPDVTTSVDEVAGTKGNLIVYPNPVEKNGVLNVVLPQGATEMSLVGLDGCVLVSKAVSGESAQMQLGDIHSGMYTLIVTGENGKETAKVLVK